MHQILKESMERAGCNDYQFFASAYFWKFNKHGDIWEDLAQYRLHAIIPPYVRDYVCRTK